MHTCPSTVENVLLLKQLDSRSLIGLTQELIQNFQKGPLEMNTTQNYRSRFETMTCYFCKLINRLIFLWQISRIL